MLVPVSWLKDYVDIDIPIELLAEKMTAAGLEVAALHYRRPTADNRLRACAMPTVRPSGVGPREAGAGCDP
jgi:hypothetical protein